MPRDDTTTKTPIAYILGLDLGSNSVGWAALGIRPESENTPEPEAACILAEGVRIFEAGMDGILEEGKEKSRNVARRQARLIRRQLDRAARRIDFIYLRLQLAGLLPELPGQEWMKWNGVKLWRNRSKSVRAERSSLRHEALNNLDAELLAGARTRNAETRVVGETELPHRLPYFLRALCLDEQAQPYAAGRALFHLAQRRGFLSNRKADAKDEEAGKVKEAIKKLGESMREAEARTLGEFFLRRPEGERLRGRWTSRAMYEAEFDAIWRAQAKFNPEAFTDTLRNDLHRAIFRQRPLKSQAKFIGQCEWEKDRKRAPLAALDAQRFRLLQQVNHLRIRDRGGVAAEKELSGEQRTSLVESLENGGDLTFAKAKKLLGLKRGEIFNLEEGGEKRLIGNRTSAKLAEIFGPERWLGMTGEERDGVVEDWRKTQKDETLHRRGLKLGLDEAAAKAFAALALEDGYAGLSKRALSRLLPHLEKGMAYMEACVKEYGGKPADAAAEQLPPVDEAAPGLRNPTVMRILTEVRTVVNALIAKYGKPAAIRLELARELRKGKKARVEIAKRNRSREEERAAARGASVFKELGIANPSRADIEKILLHTECKGECPYTGKHIEMRDLFNGTFQVEHIVPLSVSLDDSFLNKTLCHVAANQKKGNRTPYQAFGHDKQLWDEITARVKKFPRSMNSPKVQRFLATENPELEDFARQQLNDTSHASKAALDYLRLLYGGEALKRVQAGRGGVTAFLRNEWGLNRVLGDGDGKNRDDHRHHAVDAVAIALTSRRAMKMLSEAAVNAARDRRRRFGHLAMPWKGFLQDVKEATDRIVVSRRVSRKVSGPLHEATYYGPGPKKDGNGGAMYYHVRTPLHRLKADDVEDDDLIVDKAVRRAAQAKLKTFPKNDPKLFENDPPFLVARDGRRIPIRSARIRMKKNLLEIGQDATRRYAVGGNNHHAEIVALLDDQGRQTGMDWEMVSMFEAHRRKKNREPIVQRDHGTGRKFLFSLGFGESVILTNDDNIEGTFTCRGTSESELTFTLNTDARMQSELISTKARVRIKSGKALAARKLRKIVITPLGEIRNAND